MKYQQKLHHIYFNVKFLSTYLTKGENVGTNLPPSLSFDKLRISFGGKSRRPERKRGRGGEGGRAGVEPETRTTQLPHGISGTDLSNFLKSGSLNLNFI